MTEPLETETTDRRSPVGDFLMSTMLTNGTSWMSIGELLGVANAQRLTISQVLAWVDQATKGGVLEQGELDGDRAIRLTGTGLGLGENDRRAGR